MKKNTIHQIKLALINDFSNKMLSENFDADLKLNIKKLINLLNESSILSVENAIYENLLTCKHKKDVLILETIKENFNKLNPFTKDDLDKAHKLLNENFKYDSIETSSLHNNISQLIENFEYGLFNNKNIEYVENIMEEIKNNEIISDKTQEINEEILNIAYDIHEKTKNNLSKTEIDLYEHYFKEKNEELFLQTKNNLLETLDSVNNPDIIDKINETRKKINEMVYNKENVVSDIIKLNRLNENLKEN
jgi:hypothetical protein